MSDNSRRHFLKKTIGITGGLLATSSLIADTCGLTPKQTPGPFYPVSKIVDDSINDLTIIEGHQKRCRGEIVFITGTVMDEDCNPVSGALVEIWQAAESGRYNHPSDTSGLNLDPDFQNWGEFITGADGKYVFQTVIPGHYPADNTWIRPPHIHYKVTRRGYRELVTQMYFTPSSFAADKAAFIAKLNADDLILRAVKEKERVIVELIQSEAPMTLGPLLAYRQGKLVPVGKVKVKGGEKVGNFDTIIHQLG